MPARIRGEWRGEGKALPELLLPVDVCRWGVIEPCCELCAVDMFDMFVEKDNVSCMVGL